MEDLSQSRIRLLTKRGPAFKRKWLSGVAEPTRRKRRTEKTKTNRAGLSLQNRLLKLNQSSSLHEKNTFKAESGFWLPGSFPLMEPRPCWSAHLGCLPLGFSGGWIGR